MPILEFKVVMIGAVATGKTSIVNRLQYAQFDDEYQPTIGAGFVVHRTTYSGQDVELHIWDTAGMERYRSLGPIYYRDAVAAIIVYDQTDEKSASDVEEWLEGFRGTVKSNPYIAVVANKDDLENKVAGNERVRKWCNDNGFGFFITSAKTGTGIQEVFEETGRQLVAAHNSDVISASVTVRPEDAYKLGGWCAGC